MSVLSTYLCPNCGHQDLWEEPSTKILCCNKCWAFFQITPCWRDRPKQAAAEMKTEIFELAESELDPDGNLLRTGVSL
jgi:ribosomal protein L37AE/L43A